MATHRDYTVCRHLEFTFIKINGVIIFIRIQRWKKYLMGVVLATHSTKASFYRNDAGLILTTEIEKVEDEDLIKLWPHRTRKTRSSYRIAIEEELQRQLEYRGYRLNDHKWVKKAWSPV